MIPTLFTLWILPVHSFGLMMVLAFICSWKRLCLSLKEVGESIEIAEPMITWAAVGGIIGARLGYLVSFPTELLQHPIETILGGAGFVFHWGLIGGFLAVTYYLRRQRKNFFQFADIVAPTIAIGYAVGRIGCQLSGDGDYGKISNLPWAMSYSLGVIPTDPGVLVHPTPIYETIVSLLIALLLLAPATKKIFSKPGQIFGLCLIFLAIERFLVEFVRIEPIVYFNLTQAQLVSIFLFVVGLIFILVGFGKPGTHKGGD